MDDDGVIEMQFSGAFERNSFRNITRRLYGESSPSVLSLDLENVDYSYATAVVPLISLVRHLEDQGTDVDIGQTLSVVASQLNIDAFG